MKAKLTKKTKLTKDMFLLSFKADTKFNYKAGQHIVVSFIHEGKETLRPYSFYSEPSTSPNFELLIKKYRPGIGSVYMTSLKVGDEIKIVKIKGNLYLRNKNKKNIFLSTGTGVVPMVSMIRTLQNKKSELYFGCRYKEDIISFMKIKQKVSKINVIISKPKKNWSGSKGYVQDNIKTFDKNSDYYICGVPKMVIETEKKLLSKGVPIKNIHIEGWEKFDKEVDLIHKFGRLNKLTNYFVNKLFKHA